MEECIIRDGSFSITNWGKLEVVERAPRLGRNPKTGEEVKFLLENLLNSDREKLSWKN